MGELETIDSELNVTGKVSIKTPDVFPITIELATGNLGNSLPLVKSLILYEDQCQVKDFCALQDINLRNALEVRNE